MGRREHNEEQIKAFLDRYYPESFQGRPDPEMTFDDNKKGSRVILKAGAYKRIESRYRVKDGNGNEANPATNESFNKLLDLFSRRASGLSELHLLASRLVLLNANTAGGYKEMERLEDLGRKAPKKPEEGGPGALRDEMAAAELAVLCRTVIRFALDELDREGYWLDIGDDETYRSKRHEEGQRRSKTARYTREDAYRSLYDRWREAVARGLPKEEAKARIAKERDVPETKVREAIAFCRKGENGDDGEAA